MERIMKVVAVIDYMFSISDDLDEKETLDELEDRIRSGDYFPTSVVNCELLEVIPQ